MNDEFKGWFIEMYNLYFLASIIQFKPPNEIVQKLNYRRANVLKTKLIKTGCWQFSIVSFFR